MISGLLHPFMHSVTLPLLDLSDLSHPFHPNGLNLAHMKTASPASILPPIVPYMIIEPLLDQVQIRKRVIPERLFGAARMAYLVSYL